MFNVQRKYCYELKYDTSGGITTRAAPRLMLHVKRNKHYNYSRLQYKWNG